MGSAEESGKEGGFSGAFPEASQFAGELPQEFIGDAGFKLVSQRRFPLLVRTDEYPPLAKFPARFGIIEAKGDGMMPGTLRNLEGLVAGRVARTVARDDAGGDVGEKADAAINWLKNKLDESKQSGGGVTGGYCALV